MSALKDPDLAYLSLIAIAGERVRTGGWTMADALAFGSALQDRFARQYGRSLRMSLGEDSMRLMLVARQG